jgi:hypothetical protein
MGGTAAVLQHNGSKIDLTESWDKLTTRGGLLLGGLLFVSYLLGGYVAGRMGWRRGWLHGLAVFIGSIVIVGAVALLVRSLAKPDDVERVSDALRSFGIPTTRDEWRHVGSFVGAASLGGMFLGSLLGGVLGEWWFTKVSRHALQAEVDLRERMEASNDRLAAIRRGNGNGHQSRAAEDFDELSKDELYQRAQDEDIPGRSQMTKEELKKALQKQHS